MTSAEEGFTPAAQGSASGKESPRNEKSGGQQLLSLGSGRAFPRTLDIVFGVALILIVLPILVLISILIKLESPGPVLFSQERLGRDGAVFRLYKFRTMHSSAEDAEIRIGQTMKTDWRITRIGKFLRKTTFDELPQLFSVVLGDMSLVGPRPLIPFDIEKASSVVGKELLAERLRFRPGLTGFAQTHGLRSSYSGVDLQTMIKADVSYMQRRTLWTDLHILARTVMLVISNERAY